MAYDDVRNLDRVLREVERLPLADDGELLRRARVLLPRFYDDREEEMIRDLETTLTSLAREAE